VAAVTGNNHKGHFLGQIAQAGQPFGIDGQTVIDGIPQPGEGFEPDLDKGLLVVGGDFVKVAPNLLGQRNAVLFVFLRVFVQKPVEVGIVHHHADELRARLQRRSHNRRFFLLDPVDQLSAQIQDHLVFRQIPDARQIVNQVDRLGGNHKRLLRVAHEGDQTADGARVLHLTEKNIDQTFVFFFPAAAVGDQNRHNEDGKGQRALQGEKAGQRILGGAAFDEFRFSQVDDDAFPPRDLAGQIVEFALPGDAVPAEAAQKRRPVKLQHFGQRLPEGHVDAVAVHRQG